MPHHADEPGNQFASPPEGFGRGSDQEDTSDGDEAALEFVAPPSDVQTAAAEAAAVETGPELLASVNAAALEVKQAIEQQLIAGVTGAAGTRSIGALADSGNIQGVAIGLSDEASGSAGIAPGLAAVTVYVAEPTTASAIQATLVDSMGIAAAASDEVHLNVQTVGLIDAQPHRFRIRRAPGGVSVAHFKVTAGTIGCLATGRSAPRNQRLMILSNNHVIANSNNAVFGDCIAQPGPFDGGKCPADQIAVLERFAPINFAGGVNFVDCATGWAWPDRVRPELVFLSGGVPQFFRIGNAPVAPTLGTIVGKSGRTTQLTQGRITGVNATIRVNYGGGRVALFQDQFAVERTSAGLFSDGGDSGSSIWTWTPSRNPVGLLFAGGGGVTFANRMTRVLAALDINLWT